MQSLYLQEKILKIRKKKSPLFIVWPSYEIQGVFMCPCFDIFSRSPEYSIIEIDELSNDKNC